MNEYDELQEESSPEELDDALLTDTDDEDADLDDDFGGFGDDEEDEDEEDEDDFAKNFERDDI